MSFFPRAVWTNRWIVHSQVSPCLFDLRLHFRASLSLSKRSRDTGTQLFTSLPVLTLVLSQANKTSFSISWVNCCPPTGLTVLDNSVFGFGWIPLGVFAASSEFWIQFFHQIIFDGNLKRMPRWRIYILVYDFSSFHHNSFRDTISCECVVKDRCIRSCLIELRTFLLN